MPEGPEVRIIRKQLNKLLEGKKVKFVFNTEFYRIPFLEKEVRIIKKVKNKGKVIYFELDNDKFIINHLGMTGRWLYTKKVNDKHHLRIEFDDGFLLFLDYRRFGEFKLVNNKELKNILESLGPDVFSKDFNLEFLQYAIRSSKKRIAEFLVDQKIISGIGNYLRSDILYHARIYPMRNTSQLTDAEVIRLYHSIIAITKRSYEEGGASLITYRNIYGEKGRYE
ncbi:MAG: DNA-formamidopyrimidine glycosylase family protein, partial [Nitrososphaerota archaeon]